MNRLHKTLRLVRFFCDYRRDIEVFGMFGPGNLGDEAMLVAAQATLPEHRLVPWQHYGKHPLLAGLIRRRGRKHLLVGGGTLIHGGDTKWLDYVEMRSKQGVCISFCGTGIAFTEEQKSNRSESFKRWQAILMRSTNIHLRGPHSAKLSTEMCGRGDVFGDFAFLLHRSDLRASESPDNRDTIGVNLGDCLGDQARFESSAIRLVQYLGRHHKLVFHAVVESDLDVTYRVIASAGLLEKSYHVEKHFYDPYAFMRSIRSYRAFIGLKLHAAGLSMVAGVPTLMIAYLPKCSDFMGVLPDAGNMLLHLPLDDEDAASRLDRLLDNPVQFTRDKQIAEVAAVQRETLARLFGSVEFRSP